MLKIFVPIFVICLANADSEESHVQHFTNDWVVRLAGGPSVADELARELEYINLGEIKGFPDTYLMRKSDHPTRSRRHASHLTKRFADDKRVEWAEQQVARKRSKRGLLPIVRKDVWMPSRRENNRFNDDLWPDQWYLHDTRSMDNLPQLDLRTSPAWDMGYTGKGIVVTVMDDGLEWNHTDIIDNYDPEASWDSNDNDSDPFPRYDVSNSNNHGTRCAGEIAMSANNDKCGVGVAYEASIGGIRMLDGSVTDVVESTSLAHNVHHIDVFSASWGPSDDGMTVDGPKRLAVEALQKGIKEADGVACHVCHSQQISSAGSGFRLISGLISDTSSNTCRFRSHLKGRGGKGVIYVWASGNGGSKGDNCNCDGYTNSIYTLSVGSASQHGDFPWYGERCASTMTTAYSSGAYTDQKISTTDLHNRCTIHHTGTSAAAPLAAGIVALILQANPELTWRDMQHLVVWNSEYLQLRNNKGWKRNSAGLMYNSRFGFGLMNAEAMVKAAKTWVNVPPKTVCEVSAKTKLPLKLSSKENSEVEVVLSSDGCKGTTSEIHFLEHVEVTLDIEYTNRGSLDIFVTSPADSVSMLLSRRARDSSSTGFRNWTFLTVHFWGENPEGQWKLLIRDKTERKSNYGEVKLVKMTLHGTKDKPHHMKDGPRQYGSEALVTRTIDRTPEYEEDDPSINDIESVDNSLDSIRASSGKSLLDWEDLIGKQLRRIDMYDEDSESYQLPAQDSPEYLPIGRTVDYANYYD